LGASIALAAGSQGLPVSAIAEWYGSLPDSFFNRFDGMPPLLILHGALDSNIPVVNGKQMIRLCEMKELICANHIYPDQGHGFEGVALRDAEERTLFFLREHQHAQEVKVMRSRNTGEVFSLGKRFPRSDSPIESQFSHHPLRQCDLETFPTVSRAPCRHYSME